MCVRIKFYKNNVDLVHKCKPTCRGSKITLLHLRSSKYFCNITYKRNKVINCSFQWL